MTPSDSTHWRPCVVSSITCQRKRRVNQDACPWRMSTPCYHCTRVRLEPADINPVAVRHNRANIQQSRGRGCFLYASRTKKTGSYVAICAQEYRPHMSTTTGSVRFGEVTSILKHSFLDTSFTWVRVALYPLPQHDSPFWHSEDTSVETCLVESRYISHPLTCARACDERRIYFLNSKLLVI